jgi:hypothetical protein
MATFQFFIDDDRYEVPQLIFVGLPGVDRARERAGQILLSVPHYRGIEVRDGDRLLFRVGRADAGSANAVG